MANPRDRRFDRGCSGALCLLAATLMMPLAQSAAAQQKYVGVAKCKVCHMNAKLGGANYNAWKASPHARAYETLATEKAKAKAKELKIADPQTSERCVKCHVTAYGVPVALVGPGVKNEDGVGCERCHGPGSDYAPNEVMRDRKVAVAKGLIVPNEKLCRECHNQESPFYKAFDYKSFFAKIAHPKSGTTN
ncbi:MAG: cytochrome c family protein [Acidobacteria bacterium]|nr:cytochrome c family protein [Acidobacteriota bacterium]